MRLHQALLKIGIDSEMWVDEKATDLPTVFQMDGRISRALTKLRPYIGRIPLLFSKSYKKSFLSFAFLPSKWTKMINQSNADLVHLHWINREMLSIKDVSRIKKPIVWTFHDMWPFCGSEHYSERNDWQTGYSTNGQPHRYDRKTFLDRWVWNRKKKHWATGMVIIAPSNWLADCTQRSPLTCKWRTEVIPNGLDTKSWTPIDRGIARQILNLPKERKLILFGALGGQSDERKGFSLLKEALEQLKKIHYDCDLVLFGQSRPLEEAIKGFNTHYLGHLYDDISLRLAYSAANVMVVPSRQEVFGQTATEALACGTPIAAFKVGGLIDIVTSGVNGYLASPFDVDDLQKCITQSIDLSQHQDSQAHVARSISNTVLDTHIAGLHKDLYQTVILNCHHLKT